MNIFPAIDLFDNKAVRLYKGDYAQMTVYHENPLAVAEDFVRSGAEFLHLVDLQGARDGGTPHEKLIRRLKQETGLFTEVGGGIRDLAAADAYLSAGVDRVILGTAAVTDESFLRAALKNLGDRVAVGIDLKDGFVAIKGWTERSPFTGEEFFEKMEALGVKTVICTDIARDGAMRGANRALYQTLSKRFTGNIIASGGVSAIEDIVALKAMGLYGAIVGKAYYTKAIDLKTAIEVAL